MKKVSPLQLAAVMLCLSFTELAALRPEGTELSSAVLSELLCPWIFFVLLLPVTLRRRQAQVCGRAAAAVYLCFLGFCLTMLLTGLAGTVQYAFPGLYSPAALIASAAAAALYCASMGSRACAKTACAAFAAAVICTVLLCAGAAKHFSADRLYLPESSASAARAMFAAFARSAEVGLFCVLLPESRCRPVKTAAVYSAVRSAAGAGLLLFAKGALGSLAEGGQPVFMLSSYSKTAVIERFDAALLLVWALTTIVSCSVILGAAMSCLRLLAPKKRPLRLGGVFAALCAAGGIAVYPAVGLAGHGRAAAVSAALLALVLAAAYLSRAFETDRRCKA